MQVFLFLNLSSFRCNTIIEDVLEEGEPWMLSLKDKHTNCFNCINIPASVPGSEASYIIRVVSYHDQQAFNIQSNNGNLHFAANHWGSCSTTHFTDWARHDLVVTFVMLCCSVASPVIILRGLAGNKAAALLWGCRAWLLTSHTMQHKGGGGGLPPNGDFPATQGASSRIMW